jgi:uncharacterized protein (DUF58 family)
MSSAHQTYRYLKPEDVLRLGGYEFAAKAMVEGYMAGRHRSRQRGASIEFHEYREYTPGDDPALVDWRVFARTDRHYLRTFEQETHMECHLFLDSSGSMGFASPGAEWPTKLDYASFAAACLSWLVLRGHDRVSLHLFDAEVRAFFPPGSTRKHLHEVLTSLEKNRPGGRTDLPEALRRARPMLKRKGTLVVISDFLAPPEEVFAALNPYLHAGFRVQLFHILDPGELDLPDRGLARFEDMETKSQLVLHTSNVREAYGKAMAEHLAAMRRLATTRQVGYTVARTDQSYFVLLDALSA